MDYTRDGLIPFKNVVMPNIKQNNQRTFIIMPNKSNVHVDTRLVESLGSLYSFCP